MPAAAPRAMGSSFSPRFSRAARTNRPDGHEREQPGERGGPGEPHLRPGLKEEILGRIVAAVFLESGPVVGGVQGVIVRQFDDVRSDAHSRQGVIPDHGQGLFPEKISFGGQADRAFPRDEGLPIPREAALQAGIAEDSEGDRGRKEDERHGGGPEDAFPGRARHFRRRRGAFHPDKKRDAEGEQSDDQAEQGTSRADEGESQERGNGARRQE